MSLLLWWASLPFWLSFPVGWCVLSILFAGLWHAWGRWCHEREFQRSNALTTQILRQRRIEQQAVIEARYQRYLRSRALLRVVFHGE